MSYIIALDQGTTSSRTLLINKKGKIIKSSQKEFTQITPKSGWVEHDAEEIWESQLSTLKDILNHCIAQSLHVAAIGITNQRETTLLWQKSTGKPIHNAIVWQDRRTADFCKSMKESGHEEAFRRKSGLPLDPYFSGTKVRYILDHVDGARDLASDNDLCFGTVDSWLIYKLTSGRVHATDVTNSSRTLMCNIQEHSWDDELLRLLDIPVNILPEIKENDAHYGTLNKELTGLDHDIPIHGVAGDQQAALFGQMCWSAGMVKNTYGTGCFALMNVGDSIVHSQNGLLSTVAWKTAKYKHYALEGSVFIGGAAVQWLRDGLQIIDHSHEVEALANQVEDTEGVVFVPALAGLGTPHWDPYARGTIIGIHRGTSTSHIARATLEAVALQSMDLITAMEKDSGQQTSVLHVDGGATQNGLLMQMQSDFLDVKVHRPENQEKTAMGAAYLAGLGCGLWSYEDIESFSEGSTTFVPQMDGEAREHKITEWNRAIERSKSWAQ